MPWVKSTYIANCTFENSVNYYAVVIMGYRVNASVINCTFLSNNGAIYIYTSLQTAAHLLISETLFQRNSMADAVVFTESVALTVQSKFFHQQLS